MIPTTACAGEKVRELLVQCEASKYLRFDLGSTSPDVEPLLDLLPQLSPELRSEKAKTALGIPY